jgi:hypothetical protein
MVSTIDRLEKFSDIDIVLVDNESTYEPTVQYLSSTQHQVIYARENIGHLSPWRLGLVPKNSRFAVTDPDVRVADDCPDDLFIVLNKVLDKWPNLLKAGVGLRIDNLPNHYFDKNHVIQHESQFWVDRLGEIDGTTVFSSAIDTTLALYSRVENHSIWPAARLDYPYVAEHLAWYVDSNNLTEDEIYYRANCNKEIASWRYGVEH